jgi:hypothetical protein
MRVLTGCADERAGHYDAEIESVHTRGDWNPPVHDPYPCVCVVSAYQYHFLYCGNHVGV